jgi:hypothetical protein
MAQVTISLRSRDDAPAFDFTRDGGLAARVSNVMIFDDRRTEEVWEVSALAGHAVRERAKTQLEERLRSEHLAVPDEMDPLADFLADDPCYLVAKQVRDAGYRVASIELRSVIYGVVPPGFEQTIPERGLPARLQPGHTYRVVLLGGDFGSLAFEAPPQ